MLICHSQRLIVFSCPKTGSESLRAALAPLGEEVVRPWRAATPAHPFYPHMPPVAVAAEFARRGWDFAGYRRISVIRDPFARLVSLYRMIAAVDGGWRVRRRLGGRDPRFVAWLERTQPHGHGGGGRPHQRWRRYGAWSAYHWCHDAGGRCLVTDLVPLDRLGTVLPGLLADLGGGDRPLPRLNTRPATDWRRWYNADSAALVAARYAWDIAYLNDFAPGP